MTKSNLIHYILSTWSGENNISYTFKQQQELVKKLSKYLIVKKSAFTQKEQKVKKK